MLPLLLTLATASAFDAPTADRGEHAIVNGQEVEGEGFPSAWAIGLTFGAQQFSTCSASLITPRILLTAAHCSAEFGVPVEMIQEFGIAMFDNVASRATETRRFVEIINHPEYTSIGRQGNPTPLNDIAVIVLDEDASFPATWFRTRPLTLEQAVGATVTSVGYGVTSGAQQGGGIKRWADMTVDDLDDQFVLSAVSTNPGGTNICQGDSGGPQYHDAGNGKLVQWGVHSWGDQGCLTLAGSTRTDAFADWVLGHVEDVHGTRDGCTINDWYGDGACDAFCEKPDPDCLSTGQLDPSDLDAYLADEWETDPEGVAEYCEIVFEQEDALCDTRKECRQAFRTCYRKVAGCDSTGLGGFGLLGLGFVAGALRRRRRA